MQYYSDEERYFASWLQELKDAGFIVSYEYEPTPFVLLDQVVVDYNKQMKTKVKPQKTKIFDQVIYTTDFKIEWNESLSDGIFTWRKDGTYGINKLPPFIIDTVEPITYVEVKPDFDRHNMTREARLKIAWVYNRYGINVRLWRTKDYDTTFYPESMLLTPTGIDKRKKVDGNLVPLRTCVPTIKNFKDALRNELLLLPGDPQTNS